MPAPRPGASLTPTTEAKERIMAIGPVQLLVLGFKEPNFSGEIRAELDRLRDNDLIRSPPSSRTRSRPWPCAPPLAKSWPWEI